MEVAADESVIATKPVKCNAWPPEAAADDTDPVSEVVADYGAVPLNLCVFEP